MSGLALHAPSSRRLVAALIPLAALFSAAGLLGIYRYANNYRRAQHRAPSSRYTQEMNVHSIFGGSPRLLGRSNDARRRARTGLVRPAGEPTHA